jgi:hypothetical protein
MEHYDKITKPAEMASLSEKSMLFRMDARTWWSRFAWSLLNYSIALNSEIDGKEQAEQRIYSHAKKIGEMVVPYYGEDAGRVFGEALSSFGKIGVTVMQELKAGVPINGSKALWDLNIEEISTMLSTINPTYWPKEPVKSYLNMLVAFWLDSIRSRDARNWEANEIAIDNIDKLVTTGSEEMPSFADVFSSGIIAKFPEKFVG